MTEIQITEHPEQATAFIRAHVPMAELADFFSSTFSDVMAALQKQGVRPAGPPFGKYYGMPRATVDVEAGFPVAGSIEPAGNVVPGQLPAGRIVQATHVGTFDTLANTYADIETYFAEHKLTPSAVMWENYLADPETEQNSEDARTQICWPVD
ncbi:GyrI-like domain-containing protein [Arthrobacter koreensis]|uniref:GyrI-like domain-containing protein n=1 Tax=Arthrobacter koreensis TaxID=199136 RepID=UPI002DB5AFCB|nr:GyrI-like domain-containing protein [Arthrobacter koreensis]MEB7504961.1 GyrI-like domain-containing protein [Arthrobacter koreensis]